MQRAKSILAVLMAVPLAGCLLRGKPNPPPAAPVKPAATAPVPPPEPPPLSIPQTSARLPAPQPLPEGALATTEPAEEPPARTAPPAKPTIRRPTASRPNPAPVDTSTAPPPATVEPERAPIQEIVPADQQNWLRENAKASRRETLQILARVQSRRITKEQRDSIGYIRGFVKQSEDAEKSGNLPQAKQLADKALGLAKDLR